MTRVFSGIKPTGEMHLGNYLGAVRRWVDAQPEAGSVEARDHHAIFCVVDLHAMTIPWDPAELTESTRRLATLLAAAGLGGDRSLLFVQSHVRAHAELTWLLNCVASFGELRRMTQFKDKVAKQGEESIESVSVGFFDYPVLMVSDILLYDTAEVPVGDDQRQHVELARDVAIRFNGRFGDTFVVPKATFPAVGARVMDLQHPENKMSKSEDSPQGTILVLDPPKTIEKKIKSAVTDSGAEVRHDRDEQARACPTSSRSTARSPATPSPRSRRSSTPSSTACSKSRWPKPSSSSSGRCRSAMPNSRPTRPRSTAGSRSGPTPRKRLAEPVLARASLAAGLLPRSR